MGWFGGRQLDNSGQGHPLALSFSGRKQHGQALKIFSNLSPEDAPVFHFHIQGVSMVRFSASFQSTTRVPA
jgi:hypothetical protein